MYRCYHFLSLASHWSQCKLKQRQSNTKYPAMWSPKFKLRNEKHKKHKNKAELTVVIKYTGIPPPPPPPCTVSVTVTQVQQQRPELPTVILTWHACKYKVQKLHQSLSLRLDFYTSPLGLILSLTRPWCLYIGQIHNMFSTLPGPGRLLEVPGHGEWSLVATSFTGVTCIALGAAVLVVWAAHRLWTKQCVCLVYTHHWVNITD